MGAVLNPQAEAFFAGRSARDEVGTALLDALKKCGEYEVRGDLRIYKSPYAITAGVVFCGAAGTSDAFFRLRPEDHRVALATGAEAAQVDDGWVRIALFRPNWPAPDLPFWALRAYNYARVGK